MTKPDESGIKCVVQFVHKKLDPVHIKNRVFSELPFHFLVTGELELVLQDRIKPEEARARLHFLKTLCYDREYLNIEDLRDQYDATLKNIERGSHQWGDYKELESIMQSNLTFRLVNARGVDGGRLANPEVKKDNAKSSQITDIPEGKVVYCSDFNKKTCPFEDHHQGIFNKKSVTKWHIFSKCLAQEGHPERSHPASECKSA